MDIDKITTLGRLLTSLRRARVSLTQEGAARSVGVSRQTLASWEADNAIPGAGHLAALLDEVDATPEQRTAALDLAGDAQRRRAELREVGRG